MTTAAASPSAGPSDGAASRPSESEPSMETVSAGAGEMAVRPLGLAPEAAGVQIVWAHGWGVDHRLMAPLTESFRTQAANWLIDFPGFGRSPRPPEDWGTADYADAVAAWLKTLPQAEGAKRVWVGHSFGGRVAVQLAARHPETVDAIVLIAGAGLQRRRTPLQRLKRMLRGWSYKLLKTLTRDPEKRKALAMRFGSADYRAAGAMRPIFVKVVQEDLSREAERVRCPALLIYGALDQETPAEFGARYQRLMADAAFVELPGLDHYSVLGDGRHQVLARLKEFIDAL